LEELLPEVEQYAINELLPALAKGGFLEQDKKEEVASTMARYSGISEKEILQHNLEVPYNYFWKDLLRDQKGMTVGRLDSRYVGLDRKEAGDSPDYNAELTSWLHSFTPAINHYLRNDLNFKTDLTYYMFGPVHPWDRSRDNTGENLRQAMAQNPNLDVLIQSGYFDGATTYFDAKYTMWQLDPSGKMRDRLHFKGYRSGHMMYLRNEDLKKANDDVREFIQRSLPQPGTPATY
jgi:carboxypeptidase C (cathepsin A)